MKKVLCISLAGAQPEFSMLFAVIIDAKHNEPHLLYHAIMKNDNMFELILAHQHNKEQAESLTAFLNEVLLPQISSVQWVAFAPIDADYDMRCKYCIEKHLSPVILHTIKAIEKSTEPYIYLPYLTR